MMNADIKMDEAKRLEALRSYQILDSLPEEAFDNLAKLASEIAGMPIAMVNLIDQDRQWTKSMIGLGAEMKELPRKKSVCQYTIRKKSAMEVTDMSADSRFSEFNYVKNPDGLRYYFGVPLVTGDDYAIGSLCVMDYDKSTLDDRTIRQLKILATEVMTHLELHKQNLELQKLNDYKVQLMKMLSHDMRSPLNGIIGLSGMLREQLENEESKHTETIDIIEQSSTRLNQMIDEVMNYSLIESEGLTLSPGKVNLQKIIENTAHLYRPATRTKSIDLEFYTEGLEKPVWFDGEKFEQILGNLLSNAIKYTTSGGWVKLSLIRKQDSVDLRVTDNGIGMSDQEVKSILQNNPNQQLSKGTNGEKSTGIGFSIVKHIIDLFGGDIQIESTPGEGTTIQVEIPVAPAE